MFHEGAISLLKAQYQNGRIVHGGKKVEEKKKKREKCTDKTREILNITHGVITSGSDLLSRVV